MVARRTRLFARYGVILVIGLIGWAIIRTGIGAGPASPSPGPLRTVALRSLYSEELQPLEIALQDKNNTAITDLVLNHDEYTDGFKLVITGMEEPAAAGELTILPIGLTERFPAETRTQLEVQSTKLQGLVDRGEQQIHATWTPIEDDTLVPAEQQTTKDPLTLKIDTRGPVLDTHTLTGDPSIGFTLVLRFAEDDLDPVRAKKAANYAVQFVRPDRTYEADLVTDDNQVIHRGDTVRLVLGSLQAGTYRVLVNGKTDKTEGDDGTPVGPLTDAAGNHAGGQGTSGEDQERLFTTYPEPERGPRIEFPEYLPTAPQPVTERKANPADFVETRVVRLYYFRDAHRVAQIINRTANSYNRAAVDQARRRAEEARTRADELTDERRHQEREAVHAAEELRRLENQMAQAQQNLGYLQSQKNSLPDEVKRLSGEIESLDQQIKQKEEERDARQKQPEAVEGTEDDPLALAGTGPTDGMVRRLPPVTGTQASPYSPGYANQPLQLRPVGLYNQQDEQSAKNKEIENLNKEITNLEAEKKQKEDEYKAKKAQLDALNKDDQGNPIQQTQNQIQALMGQIAIQREIAWSADEKGKQTTAKEDRAREDQFRLEVGAAHEDPDTYAPAKTDSVDPVAQVSISVIGEGVLQLRGPLKGIDKIRTMIHRIDQPLGQVRVEIITVQLNGERGERMEKPVGLVDANIGLGRFLTSQSLMMLRKAIQMKAAEIAVANGGYGHYQVDRDRKYLYQFFGRDFIDELYEMDSEFLHSENKLLSLHSMDTISLHRALFILALAKNDVREEILNTFMGMVRCELPHAEFDYRRAAEIRPHRTEKLIPPWNRNHLPWCEKERIEECTLEGCTRNAQQRYHFRNLLGFFSTPAYCDDVMNPAQREFLRLAQIYKARMIAELELKQRVMERALVEDRREEDIAEEEAIKTTLRNNVITRATALQQTRFDASEAMVLAVDELSYEIAAARRRASAEAELLLAKQRTADVRRIRADTSISALERAEEPDERFTQEYRQQAATQIEQAQQLRDELRALAARLGEGRVATQKADEEYQEANRRLTGVDRLLGEAGSLLKQDEPDLDTSFTRLRTAAGELRAAGSALERMVNEEVRRWDELYDRLGCFVRAADVRRFDWAAVRAEYQSMAEVIQLLPADKRPDLASLDNAFDATRRYSQENVQLENARYFLSRTRSDLDRKKLLDHLIDDRQEKYIDILEGTRAHIASMDNYLKRLSVALEDDFKVQFYDPAFVRIREAARQWDVTLGAVERTSILTNNRAFAKVMPQATMEFDLPKRDIMIKEAMDGALALSQDMGALLNDPTFLATFKMLGGGPPPAKVENVLPSLPSSTDEQIMGRSPSRPPEFGSALEALIPDPAIYKFETGTGFEIRPVIQPDGNSVVYDFMYMYTTDVREPVRADEKHLGRVKRHFINTQVQTSSFEIREVSRYQVALKAARTARGVPLFEDIPIAGQLFRPLPSEESSIQQNIILAHSVVYPTLFDLMGLRWAPSVVDINHISVRDAGHVVRGRYDSLTNSIFESTSRRVDEILDIEYESPEQYRPDLHHRRTQPSPYHPGGYTYPEANNLQDPSGSGFIVPDRRPPELRQPPYDPRFRNPIDYESIPYGPLQEPQSPKGAPQGSAALRSNEQGHAPRPEPLHPWTHRYVELAESSQVNDLSGTHVDGRDADFGTAVNDRPSAAVAPYPPGLQTLDGD